MLRCALALVPRPSVALQGWIPAVRCFAVGGNHMALIRELREASGAPISDVKAALQQADWDMDLAAQELRRKGVASAGKKATRTAAEGLVGVASSELGAAVVEVNSETDFVPRNDNFRALVRAAAAAALEVAPAGPAPSPSHGLPLDRLLSAKTPGGESLENAVANVAGMVRENVRLRRAFFLPRPTGGVVASYLHQGAGEGLGRIAALVVLAPRDPGTELAGPAAEAAADLARKLGMQVVASAPRFLDREGVDPVAVEEERQVLRSQALGSGTLGAERFSRGWGKPASIVDKMVMGRLQKFYQEVCLLEQPFVMDDSKRVQDVVRELGEALGVPLHLPAFLRVKVGEGVDRDDKDFAAEVAATLAEAGKA
ncbi:Elongation factor Ts, mitochondrial [Auxenochlorella protothecoides]|uniref:Elongation factor Ts, mitochondrial n=1 Tax=Auxenochlorella protothecoides TaxID=3075 RepID=A0A087SC40_AUXPR|nr:Elongation factor Ts, mitochondrial [Auxenochlorella protothecoides]KFM23294.1 Elongation factor Ts, mitochondrial [Auxenochlorella protothecoides]